MRAAHGGIEHFAMDGIISLSGVQTFGRAPGAFPGAPQVEEEERNSEGRECKPNDPRRKWPRQQSCKSGGDHHRLPLRQSSSRAQIVTAIPKRASAMNSQRRVSR